MSTPTQSFSSHTQWTPLFHFATSPLAIALLIWSGVVMARNGTTQSQMMFLAAVVLVLVTFAARTMVLRVQDRLIRLEERVRFAQLLPPDVQARAMTIRPSQLVGLRFASDAELGTLVEKVLANPGMTQKEIKMAVREWRADHFRA